MARSHRRVSIANVALGTGLDDWDPYVPCHPDICADFTGEGAFDEGDYLLLLAERTWQARPVTLFEMELHANVSKYLVLARFLAGSGPRLEESRRLWLRHQLFDKGQFRDEAAGLEDRYRDAAHWAVRFLDRLLEQQATARLRTLRRFHRASAREKLRLIDARA